MNSDIFGNLKEWGSVLDVLDSLKESRNLDEHQIGLARILRYGQNWRLLEKALECGRELNEPEDEFLSELFKIITDRNIYVEARILAVNTLLCLVPRINRKKNHKLTRTSIIRKMEDMLNSPEPPVFHAAVKESLNSIMER